MASKRLEHTLIVKLGEDTNLTDLLFTRDATRAKVVSDAFQSGYSGSFSVAASDNEDLSLGDVTAVKGIYLQVNAEVEIKLNGSTDAIQLRKHTDTSTVLCKFFIEADITQINIVNGGATAAEGIYCIWGDPS
jgi:hypothetical protein